MRTHNDQPKLLVQQRGAVAVQVAVSMTLLLGFAVLAVDTGLLYSARAELQRAADATALTATWELLDPARMAGPEEEAAVFQAARLVGADLATENYVLGSATVIDANEDVALGVFNSWYDLSGPVTIEESPATNAVEVQAMRNDARGGSIALFFGSILGISEANLQVRAAAAFEQSIVGFQVTDSDSNASLLPFALHLDSWNALVGGSITTDDYRYDQQTGQMLPGADGVPELNLYPGAGADDLPDGNFGTVDIGAADNSTEDIARQILEGVSAEDLSYFGGVLELDESGTLILNGDTGLSGSIANELVAIIGKPRAILLFTEVSGPGENALFTVVGFGGIRLADVMLTGPMKKKKVVIQPAYVVDGTAISGENGISQFCYRPPRLIR